MESETIEDKFEKAFTSLHKQSQSSQQPNETQSSTSSTQAALLQLFLSLQSALLSSDAYSLNETVKELPSSSLRYLIVQYELANLWQNQPVTPESVPSNPDSIQSPQIQSEARIAQAIERRKQLNKSVTTFLSFLSTCDHLDAISDDDRAAYLAIKSKFEGLSDRLTSQSYDPGAARANKIAKFKQNRELENKLAAFEAKHAKLLFGGSDTSTKLMSSNSSDTDSDMEDQLREYWLSRLQYSINKSLEAIPLCLQEQEFLIERETREREGQSNATSNKQSIQRDSPQSIVPSKPLVYRIDSASQLQQPIPQHMTQYLQHVQPTPSLQQQQASSPATQSVVKTIAPTGPFDMQQLLTSVNSLTSRPTRETVFRDPNPATISVEEWADAEIAAGRMPGPSAPVRVNERRGYIRSHEEPDSHDDEDEADLVGQFGGEQDRYQEEAKTLKDREWDNWKDDHERGAGNRNGGR